MLLAGLSMAAASATFADCPQGDAGLDALAKARAACTGELDRNTPAQPGCDRFAGQLDRLQALMNDPATKERLSFAAYIRAHEVLIDALAFQSRVLDHRLGRGR